MRQAFTAFLRAACGAFSLLLLSVASVNFYFDPANLFSDRTYEAGVASLMAQGRNVANVTDFDERLLQKFVADRLPYVPDVLVLGSSRAMNIGPELFPGVHFFNASVSGASLEDIYALTQLYRERNLMPSKLVLGVDPWMFNRNGGHSQWRSLAAEYARSLPGNAPTESDVDARHLTRWQQLVNAEYFMAAIQSGAQKHRGYYPTSEVISDVNIKMANGTISYRREYAERQPSVVLEKVREEAKREPVYAAMSNFRQLDADYAGQLAALLDRLQKEQVQLVLFLSPFHPEMYRMLAASGGPYAKLIAAENYVRELAQKKGIVIVGSYDPARTPCESTEFFDGMHAKPACLKKILGGNSDQLFRIAIGG